MIDQLLQMSIFHQRSNRKCIMQSSNRTFLTCNIKGLSFPLQRCHFRFLLQLRVIRIMIYWLWRFRSVKRPWGSWYAHI
jgi:hypothetical protein